MMFKSILRAIRTLLVQFISGYIMSFTGARA